jgi:branched-chain amino acid transport system ATP-binding protein
LVVAPKAASITAKRRRGARWRSAMAELEIDGITLKFGGLTVLNAISMAVEKGELFALIGPNGAGKTSVFNCISGLYRPQGAIRFRGIDVVGRKPYRVAQLGIARTFQHGELFPEMTVIDNLLTARHHRVRTGPIAEMLMMPAVRREEARHRAAAEDVLALVELTQHRDALVGNLPFGLQKIVGFARALAAEPSLLLMDEPSAGLARNEREDLAYFILRIKERLGIAMVWIEHDMQMVADLADRIHVLDYGRSLADGPPARVLNDPDVVRAYLGVT